MLRCDFTSLSDQNPASTALHRDAPLCAPHAHRFFAGMRRVGQRLLRPPHVLFTTFSLTIFKRATSPRLQVKSRKRISSRILSKPPNRSTRNWPRVPPTKAFLQSKNDMHSPLHSDSCYGFFPVDAALLRASLSTIFTTIGYQLIHTRRYLNTHSGSLSAVNSNPSLSARYWLAPPPL
ncbi:unnamed protein product [Alternaria burnsii]|nr:unnamed protein product [Alternaria burnsii]